MNVFVGMPSGRGNISVQTASTLVNLGQILNNAKISYEFISVTHADVSVARNILAALFLTGPSNIFFGIDDDVAVSSEILELFMRSSHNFLGSYLPQRGLNLAAYEAAIVSGLRGQDAQRHVAPLVGPPSDNLATPGIRQVDWIGTGFYRLRKSVLQSIISKNLVSMQRSTQANYRGDFYGFFNNISTDEKYLSEDMSFCERVKSAGYEIHAYAGPGIEHVGTMTFTS